MTDEQKQHLDAYPIEVGLSPKNDGSGRQPEPVPKPPVEMVRALRAKVAAASHRTVTVIPLTQADIDKAFEGTGVAYTLAQLERAGITALKFIPAHMKGEGGNFTWTIDGRSTLGSLNRIVTVIGAAIKNAPVEPEPPTHTPVEEAAPAVAESVAKTLSENRALIHFNFAYREDLEERLKTAGVEYVVSDNGKVIVASTTKDTSGAQELYKISREYPEIRTKVFYIPTTDSKEAQKIAADLILTVEKLAGSKDFVIDRDYSVGVYSTDLEDDGKLVKNKPLVCVKFSSKYTEDINRYSDRLASLGVTEIQKDFFPHVKLFPNHPIAEKVDAARAEIAEAAKPLTPDREPPIERIPVQGNGRELGLLYKLGRMWREFRNGGDSASPTYSDEEPFLTRNRFIGVGSILLITIASAIGVIFSGPPKNKNKIPAEAKPQPAASAAAVVVNRRAAELVPASPTPAPTITIPKPAPIEGAPDIDNLPLLDTKSTKPVATQNDGGRVVPIQKPAATTFVRPDGWDKMSAAERLDALKTWNSQQPAKSTAK
jgi:hypothetical protein